MPSELLHVLFEHASGYSLYRVKEFEEIGAIQEEVESSVTDLSRFNSVVKLVAFSPFTSGTSALDNINSISEGILHDDLKLFLETNMPKSKKKVLSMLGVADSKIAGAISEEFGFSCLHTDAVPEIIRGIRFHYHKLIKGLTLQTMSKAQLGLGHSYSRAKVKYNVHRVDNMIIQSISLMDQLDKDINTFSMRIREWYGYHFPELAKIVNENYLYAKVVSLIKDRKQITPEMLPQLEEVLMDSGKAETVIEASKSSMGMDIAPIDLINIETFTKKVIGLTDYRKCLQTYLASKMKETAPGLSTLIGDQVAARLISQAGSLTNLAKYPASTVQILGAEKALFRALKTRGNTPKYGLIFHSTFIGRAAAKNKGRISRYLANKCSIAARIDCFSEIPTPVFGEHLKNQVEDRLKFYETGEVPRKNVEVMHDALAEATEVTDKLKKKANKKAKKRKSNGDDVSFNTTADSSALDTTQEGEEPPTKKKKKKKEAAVVEDVEEVVAENNELSSAKKKKKKRKEVEEDEDEPVEQKAKPVEEDEETPAKKKKKKKEKENVNGDAEESMNADDEATPAKKKKKKKEKASA